MKTSYIHRILTMTGGGCIGSARKKSELEADEDLARGLQASLDLEMEPRPSGLGGHDSRRVEQPSASTPWFLPGNVRQR